MLADAAPIVPDDQRAAYQALRAEVGALDAGDGLPEALTHPDFVLANVIATQAAWSSSTGRARAAGRALWSLAFLLYAEGAKDQRRADVVLAATAGT